MIYHFESVTASGEKQSLETYKGKVLLIVNTASKCRFTPQFDDLQKLYENYREQGFEILGFPCNQFGEQEPGTSEEAQHFCQANYGVSFPIFSKINVNGEYADPLFQYLKKAVPFEGFDETNIQVKLLKALISEKYPEYLVGNEIKWNFTKFLVDSDGTILKRYEPAVEPSAIAGDIEQLLLAAAYKG